MDEFFDGEFMAEWQGQSMEDAIWTRDRRDYWWKVPYKYRTETETEIIDDLPEYGSPELPF